MKKEKTEIIDSILKNSISKNEIKKITRIENWYSETQYSEDVYLPFTNYFEYNKKPELGCFLFKYLLSNNSLRELRSLLDSDKNFRNYITNSSECFLKFTIQFFNFTENWNEIVKNIIEIEKNKNKSFFIQHAPVFFSQYRPIDSILHIFFKKEDLFYWFGNEQQQCDLQYILLELIDKNESFKYSKNPVIRYVKSFANSIMDNKESNTLCEELKSFFTLIDVVDDTIPYSKKVNIAKHINKQVLKQFTHSLTGQNHIEEKTKEVIRQDISQIISLKEKQEMEEFVSEPEFSIHRKRI